MFDSPCKYWIYWYSSIFYTLFYKNVEKEMCRKRFSTFSNFCNSDFLHYFVERFHKYGTFVIKQKPPTRQCRWSCFIRFWSSPVLLFFSIELFSTFFTRFSVPNCHFLKNVENSRFLKNFFQ